MLTYVRDLGPGAFGLAKLYKTRSGDYVCVKEVHYPRDTETRKQVLNEVRSMEACDHPNVVAFLDSWVSGTRLNIMMEYCSNGSLNMLIQKQARRGTHFPLIKITHYLQELAEALRYCHEELRMVHRDIKPDNIFIDGLGSLKLGDFGMSKTLETPTAMCATFCGTPLFISPEQHVGLEYSFPTDIWALGCVFYQLVELRDPWPGCYTVEALSRRVLKRPEFSSLHGYPSIIIDTSLWMLQVDTHLRPTATMLVEHLAPRAPPPVYKTGVEKIIEDASRLAAATIIQTSFRRSGLCLMDRVTAARGDVTNVVVAPIATKTATPIATKTATPIATKTTTPIATKTVVEEDSTPSGEDKELIPATVEAPLQGVRLRKLDFPFRVPHAVDTDVTIRNVQAIQRAVRVSLNRRRRDVPALLPDSTKPLPKPRPKTRPRPDVLPVRIHELATPRVRRPVHEAGRYTPRPPLPRNAWL